MFFDNVFVAFCSILVYFYLFQQLMNSLCLICLTFNFVNIVGYCKKIGMIRFGFICMVTAYLIITSAGYHSNIEFFTMLPQLLLDLCKTMPVVLIMEWVTANGQCFYKQLQTNFLSDICLITYFLFIFLFIEVHPKQGHKGQ